MRQIDSVQRSFGMVLLSVISCLSTDALFAQENEALKPSRVEEGAPSWLKSYEFKKKTFTFIRLRYDQPPRRWATDYPDADINFSNRLRQLTALAVSPDGLVLDVADPRLVDYPFAYLSANGIWNLSDKQAIALREYLDGGGFLMIDDSWGEEEWKNVIAQMKRVFPNRAPLELSLQHRIFHSVFDLQDKPQVCGIYYALRGRDEGITWERPDAKDVSYQGITNDNGRLMVLICHNTDLADGWERMNEDAWYASEFSEKRAFPMGINTIFHVLSSSK
ncbi:MAG: DUF4159 domain-containing protein [Planctomycetota bacterium]|jgi:hypothetical protein